jgi:hypothetical protein
MLDIPSYLDAYCLTKTAVEITPGMQKLLAFLGFTGAGATLGALTTDDPLRGALVGGAAGGLGYTAAAIRPGSVTVSLPEKIILGSTGAITSAAGAGFMVDKAYESIANRLNKYTSA